MLEVPECQGYLWESVRPQKGYGWGHPVYRLSWWSEEQLFQPSFLADPHFSLPSSKFWLCCARFG